MTGYQAAKQSKAACQMDRAFPDIQQPFLKQSAAAHTFHTEAHDDSWPSFFHNFALEYPMLVMDHLSLP